MDLYCSFYMLSLLMVHLVLTGCAFLKYETKEQAIAAIEALMEFTKWRYYLQCNLFDLSH